MNNRIKQERISKGLTQAELAKKTGISKQSISYYEIGKRQPKIEAWQKLANFFGVSIPYLQGLEPNYEEITVKTWQELANVLNGFYFSPNGGIEASNQVRDYINKYLNLANIKEKPKKDSNNVGYWHKYFSFLLFDNPAVSKLNYKAYNKNKDFSKQVESRYKTFMSNVMFDKLSREISSKFTTDIGEFYEYEYHRKIFNVTETLNRKIRFTKSKDAAKNTLYKYFDELNSYRDKFLNDLNNGKFDKFILKRNEMLAEEKSFNNKIKEDIIKILSKFSQEKLDKLRIDDVVDLLKEEGCITEEQEEIFDLDRVVYDALLEMKDKSDTV
ncbi:DNA-binding XRE family transcriptional regulator [Lactobacillus colini]|uniref:DNA-binding XRE family transcriptional regulator n=1 Tax=Lactobacillus colini TaxID=1819254 RepID=A0ABS4MH78_9LACO|nr:helix-turn-helix transcriptional regulator [Lactobacillus colini]MBP2058948.1 DNA-binding XRE family transcriptional regulator [Lactobacillus colini]